MKNFNVGDRVAFSRNGAIGVRYKGRIYPDRDVIIEESGGFVVDIESCTKIKRLVKKKRLTFWINIYSDDIHAIHNTKESAKSSMKIDGFIRTAKFVEVKE